MAFLPPGGGQDAWKLFWRLHALMMRRCWRGRRPSFLITSAGRRRASTSPAIAACQSYPNSNPSFFGCFFFSFFTLLLLAVHPEDLQLISTSPPREYAIGAVAPPETHLAVFIFSGSRWRPDDCSCCSSHPVILLIRRRSY